MAKIKLFDPFIDINEKFAINKIIKSRFWASGSGTGDVKKFESNFKKYVGSKECVALSNGTASLHLALSMVDIKNKEVILPSLSFVSTAHAVIYNGGKPVFADVDPSTLCLNPNEIQNLITSKTRVILPVHFAGMPVDMKKFDSICKKNNLILIDDAAHAAGTKYNGKKIGSIGMMTCFSFHPVKNLAMPNGGAITINTKNSKKIKNILNSKRWCGISNRNGVNYDISQLGWNYYMNEISAAIGIEQLKKLDKMNSKRKIIAKRYSDELKLENKMPFNKDCSYHFYWIRVKNRKNFMDNLLKKNIETGIHYKPIHTMKYYKTKKHLPITEQIGKEIVSLPTHPNLTNANISYIIKYVNKFL
jgi:perosamine synthetase